MLGCAIVDCRGLDQHRDGNDPVNLLRQHSQNRCTLDRSWIVVVYQFPLGTTLTVWTRSQADARNTRKQSTPCIGAIH